MKRAHDMPFGAAVLPGKGARFRLWAPALSQVGLILRSDENVAEIEVAMEKLPDGWFETVAENAKAGTRYGFSVGKGLIVPDPASRFQPDGVHALSEIIDGEAFEWLDENWKGRPWEDTVIYELHVGTFSPEGTYAAAERRLDYLAQLGITAIELMPLSTAPGERNWGYDGVYPFAPTGNYGTPDELKRFIQSAHARGMMVFLDVVYNHFGPEGNYLHKTAPQFFTDRYHTPWGAAIDFDGEASRTVRDFFVHNALFWLEEFNIDGLRFDAVHAIFDGSKPHILTEIADSVRRATPVGRHFHLVLENDKNEARYLNREKDGHPAAYVAQWNDDIHHVLHVIATGETSGYYQHYADDPISGLGRALTEGFVFQGEPLGDGKSRGEASKHLPPSAFVSFLQNHDQIGNRALGERITTLAPPEALRAITAVLLLSPSPPMLFMGEEWGSTTPFLFFCDFSPELAAAVRDGRRREFAHFPAFQDEAAQARIPDPSDPETFERSKLNWESATHDEHRAWLELHTYLLALRRSHIAPHLTKSPPPASQYARGPEGRLDVAWTFGDGSRLSLRANLCAQSVVVSDDLDRTAEAIYSTHESIAAGSLPPWYVAFQLTTG
ncbi:MAG: malto-oligosyltrehalose trehalohydrolase [Alphaproteobacteria bacterium]|nr:malto-oligosyltrehalose trehalohydrolase [Alphaproteobacteria bacterium]